MPHLVTLVGYQAVGKSTYATQLESEGYFVLSGDRVLAQLCNKYGCTTDEAYDVHRAELNATMTEQLDAAIAKGDSIVVDAFNLTKRHRARALDAVRAAPISYECSAIVFYPPEAEEHVRRITDRVFQGGRMNMADGVRMMQWEDSYEPPSKEEGFQEIKTVGTPLKEPLMVMGR